MSDWKPIEDLDLNYPIWVLKYDVWFKDGRWVDPNTPGSTKFTDCHGYYDTEEDARRVKNHFAEPNKYQIEKVYHRVLKPEAVHVQFL